MGLIQKVNELNGSTKFILLIAIIVFNAGGAWVTVEALGRGQDELRGRVEALGMESRKMDADLDKRVALNEERFKLILAKLEEMDRKLDKKRDKN